MIRLKMKNCNMILTEKHQKYQHYHHVKLINTNILQVENYYLSIEDIKTYFSSRNSLGKTNRETNRCFKISLKKSLENLSNKIGKLNQIQSIFPQNRMNDLILDRLKEINQWKNNINLNKLD